MIIQNIHTQKAGKIWFENFVDVRFTNILPLQCFYLHRKRQSRYRKPTQKALLIPANAVLQLTTEIEGANRNVVGLCQYNLVMNY